MEQSLKDLWKSNKAKERMMETVLYDLAPHRMMGLKKWLKVQFDSFMPW